MTTPTTTQELIERLKAFAEHLRRGVSVTDDVMETGPDDEDFTLSATDLRLAASRLSELQDEKNELAVHLDKTIAVAADAVTRASAAANEVVRLRAEAARAWQNLDEYIARKKTVDVTIALAFEVLRAALDQQGDRG